MATRYLGAAGSGSRRVGHWGWIPTAHLSSSSSSSHTLCSFIMGALMVTGEYAGDCGAGSDPAACRSTFVVFGSIAILSGCAWVRLACLAASALLPVAPLSMLSLSLALSALLTRQPRTHYPRPPIPASHAPIYSRSVTITPPYLTPLFTGRVLLRRLRILSRPTGRGGALARHHGRFLTATRACNGQQYTVPVP